MDALANHYSKLVVENLLLHYVDSSGSLPSVAASSSSLGGLQMLPVPAVDQPSQLFQDRVMVAKLVNGNFGHI